MSKAQAKLSGKPGRSGRLLDVHLSGCRPLEVDGSMVSKWLVNGLGIPSCPFSSTWMSRWKLVNDWLVNGLEAYTYKYGILWLIHLINY